MEEEIRDDKKQSVIGRRLNVTLDETNAKIIEATQIPSISPTLASQTHRVITRYTFKFNTIRQKTLKEKKVRDPSTDMPVTVKNKTTCKPLKYQNNWLCDSPGNEKGTVCRYYCTEQDKTFSRKCRCKSDRSCKWNTNIVPQCLRPGYIKKTDKANNEKTLMDMERTNSFPAMLVRNQDEEQIPQFLNDMVRSDSIPDEHKEPDEVQINQKLENLKGTLIGQVENEMLHELDEVSHESVKVQNPVEQTRYLTKDGEYFVNVFDFFQKLQRWMYTRGHFTNTQS